VLDALYGLTDSVAHATSLQEIHDAALDCLQAALKVERASILLLDPDEVMRFKAWRGLSDRYRTAVEGHSPWQPDEPRPAPVFVSDVAREPELAAYEELFRDEEIGALAFIPLCYGEKLLGKFMLYYRAPHSVTERECGIVRVIAGHVAFSVERMRLLDAEQRARARAEQVAARIARLQRVTASLSEALTPARVADAVISEGVEATGAQASMVFFVSARGDALEIVRDRGYSPGRVESLRRVPLASESPVAIAFRTRAPVWVGSSETSGSHAELAASVAEVQSIALACVPLAAGDTALGVMVLSFTEARMVTGEERAFICAIAEQGALALERANHYERAQRAVEAREELLRIVAHDLRNPLGAIAMTATVMHQGVLPQGAPPGWERYADIILRNTGQMKRLIRDLLHASRIEAGQLMVELDSYRLDDMLEHALEASQPQAGSRKLELHLASEAADIRVRCDRERMLQVLGNLIGNAIKYTPEHGQIVLRASHRGNEVVIAVEDTGTGIHPDHLAHIFTRYWQATDQTRHKEGVGLGLFIAKALVEAQDGRIWVDSAPGEGSTFFFTVPVDPGEQVSEAPGRTILVVDDDAGFRCELQEIFESRGYRVAVVANGKEALDYLQDHAPPGLIFFDLMMPVMDGWELYAALKTEPILASVPTVILSCVDPSRTAWRHLDVVAYLEKPVRMEQLLRIAKQYCRS
jgi:signal transduction histidine kinase